MFMVAAKAAHHNGISAPDLHALVAEAVQDEGFEGADVPAIASIGELRRGDRSWLRPLDSAADEHDVLMGQLEAAIERSKKKATKQART